MSDVTDKWKAKIDQIAGDLAAEGICNNEAKALKRAGRDVDQALRALNGAANGRTLNGVGAVAGAVTVASCPAFFTGAGAAACIVGGTVGAVVTFSNWLLGDSAVDLAREEVEDALDDLSSAIDDVCRCRTKHRGGNT